MTISVTSPGVKRSRLWFGLLGGAIPWLLHLVAAAIIAEWGCMAGLTRQVALGITTVAWMLIVISVVMMLLAIAATWSAYRVIRIYHDAATEQGVSERFDEHGTDAYLARLGLWSSAVFVLIILAQSIPIFFYLKEC